MKTKIFLLLCLFIGVGLPQLVAQKSNSKGTKSEQGWRQSTYWSPVYSGDQMVDYLVGDVMVHFVAHFKNGLCQFENDQIKGEVTSGSGEVFEIKEFDKYNFTDGLNFTWKFNLIGDWGSHYIGTLTYSVLTGIIVVERVVKS